MDRKKIVVIAFGNPLFTDEGIGNAMLAQLREQPVLAESADFIDLGTKGAALLHAVAGREAAIIIDAARMGAPPGAIRRFVMEDVRSPDAAAFLSLHEVNIFETVALARSLDDCPGKIVFFGIQPQLIALGNRLTPDLESHLCDYAQTVAAEIRLLSDLPG